MWEGAINLHDDTQLDKVLAGRFLDNLHKDKTPIIRVFCVASVIDTEKTLVTIIFVPH